MDKALLLLVLMSVCLCHLFVEVHLKRICRLVPLVKWRTAFLISWDTTCRQPRSLFDSIFPKKMWVCGQSRKEAVLFIGNT